MDLGFDFLLDVIFDRFETVRTLLKNESEYYCKIYKYNIDDYVPYDFKEFYNQIRYDEWNKIIIFFELVKFFKIEYISAGYIGKKKTQKETKSFKILAKNLIKYFFTFRKVVIIDSYMPVFKLFKLQSS